jgi:RimJ/RimL family protein N-acetyltransferase
MVDETYGVPVVAVECDEPEGTILRRVYPLEATPENLEKFYEKAKEFPTVFGREFSGIQEFADLFLGYDKLTGQIKLDGVFYVVDDFVGVMYINNLDAGLFDAKVHYTFFDKRQRGRLKLVKLMLRYAFQYYNFRRLSVELPNYVSSTTRKFVTDLGFVLEGKRRRAMPYKGKLYDVNLYGILREEVISGSQN